MSGQKRCVLVREEGENGVEEHPCGACSLLCHLILQHTTLLLPCTSPASSTLPMDGPLPHTYPAPGKGGVGGREREGGGEREGGREEGKERKGGGGRGNKEGKGGREREERYGWRGSKGARGCECRPKHKDMWLVG